jgi:hypothetical protein
MEWELAKATTEIKISELTSFQSFGPYRPLNSPDKIATLLWLPSHFLAIRKILGSTICFFLSLPDR